MWCRSCSVEVADERRCGGDEGVVEVGVEVEDVLVTTGRDDGGGGDGGDDGGDGDGGDEEADVVGGGKWKWKNRQMKASGL
jgi:hypothetical protein